MEPSSFWSKISEYGLAGLVIGVLFFILWRMLIWVMRWVDKQEEQHRIEREIWMTRMEHLDQSIQLHNQGSIEARKGTEEAHRYQREEHLEMIKTLGRINGYKV
jgi:hypothetical protein